MKKLLPFFSAKMWGSESWIVSTHEDGQCAAESGEMLSDIIGGTYPLLIKTITAEKSLSIQVHPDDIFARKYGYDYGKSECWYILQAEAGAKLVCGLAENYSVGAIRDALQTGGFEKMLRFIPVSAGDLVYIPAGTVHAILGGMQLLEVQQSSNITYRLYDWGRKRETHVEKALEALKYFAPEPIPHFSGTFSCPYFMIKHISCGCTEHSRKITEAVCGNENGSVLYVIDGSALLEDSCPESGKQSCRLHAGEVLFIEREEHLNISGTYSAIYMSPLFPDDIQTENKPAV